MSTPFDPYIDQWLTFPLPILTEIDQENRQRRDIEPNIGKQTGAMIDWIGSVIKAKHVLEFGTCLGFSTIYLANLVKPFQGTVTSIELSEARIKETEKNLEQAGLRKYVNLIHGDALVEIKKLQGPFDLILQDSQKIFYKDMLEDCVRLLRKDGILFSDDTLFPAMDVPQKYQQPIHDYNQAVFNHPLLKNILLPIGDGLTLSVKK